MVAALEDLAIEPSPGSTTLLHGFPGVTPSVAFSGMVTFTARRQLSFRSLKLRLSGTATVSFVSSADARCRDSASLLERNVALLDPASASAAAAAGIGGGGGGGSGKAPAYPTAKRGGGSVLVLPEGRHELPFRFDVAAEDVVRLPPSLALDFEKDELRVVYSLSAVAEYFPPGPLASAKTAEVSEDVDFPRISVPDVIRGHTMDTSLLLAGASDSADWRVRADRSVFGLSQPVTVTVDHVRSLRKENPATSVHVALRQDVTLRAAGLTKVLRVYLSRPDCARAFVLDSGCQPSSTRVLPSPAALVPPAPSGGGGSPSRGSPLAVAAEGGGAARGRSLSPSPPGPRWTGRVVATVEPWRAARRQQDTLAAPGLPAATGALFEVRHVLEVIVTMRGAPPLKLEHAVLFLDADADTRDWVVRNSNYVPPSPV
ncbi:hypothetical protein HK405_004323 [Cladochytrium tenue]|nr:hypothetical protein HK405_004323 [Cladochytrium tenue]